MYSPYFDTSKMNCKRPIRSNLFQHMFGTPQYKKDADAAAADAAQQHQKKPKRKSYPAAATQQQQQKQQKQQKQQRQQPKPKRVRISVDTRTFLWGWYIGPSVKWAMCPVCKTQQIHRNVDAGWEGAHIVPRTYDPNNASLKGQALASIMIPACRSCNNTMSTCNLIDYMYTNNNSRELCKLLWKWFKGYPFPDAIKACNGVLWRLIDAQFGMKRFPDGGGITHFDAIYPLLKQYQQKKIAKEIRKLNNRVTKLLSLSNLVGQ